MSVNYGYGFSRYYWDFPRAPAANPDRPCVNVSDGTIHPQCSLVGCPLSSYRKNMGNGSVIFYEKFILLSNCWNVGDKSYAVIFYERLIHWRCFSTFTRILSCKLPLYQIFWWHFCNIVWKIDWQKKFHNLSLNIFSTFVKLLKCRRNIIFNLILYGNLIYSRFYTSFVWIFL